MGTLCRGLSPRLSVKQGLWLGASVSVGVFLASVLVASVFHRAWEYPLVQFLDSFAQVYPAFDLVVRALTKLNLPQGVVLVAIVWWLWAARSETDRVCLLAGVGAASVAALTSRALQIVLPTHLRPLHDPALHLLLPLKVNPDVFNHWNAFPSDHSSLLFGLAATIWLVDRRIGVAAFLWATVIDLGRVYEMLHFPSDIVGGAALGVFAVYVAQNRAVLAGGRWLLRWETRAAPWFYMAAFLASYLVATMFDDVRMMGKGAAKVLVAHFLNT